MNPKYLYVSLGYKIGLSKGERSREEELKAPYDLEK